jgi:hypothetical protein
MVFRLNPSHIVQIERIQKILKFVLLFTEIFEVLTHSAPLENAPRVSKRILLQR